MKKIHLIEAVQEFFASDLAGEQKHIYHPEEIKVWLNNVFNQIIYNTWLNGKKFSDFSQLDAWSRYYEIDIETQVGTGAHLFLPFPPVQLPDNAGIREVRDHDNPSNVFVPVEITSNPIFAELEVSTMDSVPTYHVEQNNMFAGAGEPSHILRMNQMPIGGDAIESVDVLMITTLEQLDDFDDLVMPSAMEETIVRSVIDFMIKKPAPDTGNDMVVNNTPTS